MDGLLLQFVKKKPFQNSFSNFFTWHWGSSEPVNTLNVLKLLPLLSRPCHVPRHELNAAERKVATHQNANLIHTFNKIFFFFFFGNKAMTGLRWLRLTHIVALLKSSSMFLETEKTSSRGSSLTLLKSLVCGSFSLKLPHLIEEKKSSSGFLQKDCTRKAHAADTHRYRPRFISSSFSRCLINRGCSSS